MSTQQFLLSEMARYIKGKNISVTLLAELREWVNAGNTVYDNPWYMTDEKGGPLDYLTAKTTIEDGDVGSKLERCSLHT